MSLTRLLLVLVSCLLLGCAGLRVEVREPVAPPLGSQAAGLFLKARTLLKESSIAPVARRGSPDPRVLESVQYLEAAVELDPRSSELHRHLAEALARVPRLERAVEVIRRAVQLDPKDARAQLALGTLLYESGRLDEAVEPLSRSVRLGLVGTDPGAAHRRLFKVLQRLSREEDAVLTLESWVSSHPGQSEPWERKAAYLWSVGRSDEARDSAVGAMLAGVETEELRTLLRRYYRHDPLGEAAVLEEVLQRHPGAQEHRKRLVSLHGEIGRYDRALVHLRYIPDDGSDGERPLLRRLDFLVAMQRQEEALAELARHGGWSAGRVALYQAWIFERSGNRTAALGALAGVDDQDPEFYGVLLASVRLHRLEGALEEAVSLLAKVTRHPEWSKVAGRESALVEEVKLRLIQGEHGESARSLEALAAVGSRQWLPLQVELLRRGGEIDAALAMLESERGRAGSKGGNGTLEAQAAAEGQNLWVTRSQVRLLLGAARSSAARELLGRELLEVRQRREKLLAESDRSKRHEFRHVVLDSELALLYLRHMVEKEEGRDEVSEATLRTIL
ncbi:MAG: tetratricopeptide repeat protein, partial [Myxococcota bacterium]|nr:tetratricopeptide repeat protein [Myxococcota bacterium]